eukprot:6209013-Pleurochrysis_carterae.AAC.1
MQSPPLARARSRAETRTVRDEHIARSGPTAALCYAALPYAIAARAPSGATEPSGVAPARARARAPHYSCTGRATARTASSIALRPEAAHQPALLSASPTLVCLLFDRSSTRTDIPTTQYRIQVGA